MSQPGRFKIACPSCQGHIEFPEELHGQTIDCPHCGLTTALRVPGYVDPSPRPIPPPAAPIIQKAPEAPTQRGRIKTKSEFAGVGCLIQGIGLVALFFFPIGTIIGIVLLVAGSAMASYPICSICANRLSDRNVKICPTCKAQLNPMSSAPALAVLCAVVVLVALVVYALRPSPTPSSDPTPSPLPTKAVNSGKAVKTEAPSQGLAATTPTSASEGRLLLAIPELRWSQDQFVSAGWMKPGQIVLPKGNKFSKEGVTLFGVQGEIIFNFDQKREMFDCSFYIRDGEAATSIGDEDWRSLYTAIKAICDSTETRTGFDTSLANGSIDWTINGDARMYKLALTRRVFGQRIERGLEIAITRK